jgi:hypothetical protein
MDTFKSSLDAGIRYRDPDGRIKTSASLGFSYIEEPRGMSVDSFLPRVYADARYQATAGFNVHWGSLLWAITGKATVDEMPVLDASGVSSEGIQAGTGFSYEFLRWAFSVNYIYSVVGVWREETENMEAHTGIVSVRHRATKNLDLWGSVGAVTSINYDDFFLSAGVSVRF